MRWSIRNQILMPFVTILVVAVVTIAVTGAILAARQSEQQTIEQVRGVVETLGQSSFPYTPTVLKKMQGLSGADFVTYDLHGHVLASTLPPVAGLSAIFERLPQLREWDAFAQLPTLTLDDTRYFASALPTRPAGEQRWLLVLYPEESWRRARWAAAWPPLAVGGSALVLTVAVAVWLAHRFSRRLQSVQLQVAAIAGGDFRQIDRGLRADEIDDLIESVNQMAVQLQQLHQTIQTSERTRLWGQLAGGLAHQLRNAVTGARLALQIHQQRCSPRDDDHSLEVALHQLRLTEEQVKGFLSLGREPAEPLVECPVGTVFDKVATLVGPVCEHAQVHLVTAVPAGDVTVTAAPETLRAALLNLALNAIEAAGPGGEVELAVHSRADRVDFEVFDTGPGPPRAVQQALFEPFVTSKAEGVGLGLALAQQVATELGGKVAWERVDERTCFRLTIPLKQSLC